MISTGSIFYLFKDAYHFSNTVISAGGIIGRVLTAVLLKYANITGCVIILSFFVIIGFTLSTGISLKDLALFIRRKILALLLTMKQDFNEAVVYVNERISKVREQRKTARIEKAKKLEELRALPEEIEVEDEFKDEEVIYSQRTEYRRIYCSHTNECY